MTQTLALTRRVVTIERVEIDVETLLTLLVLGGQMQEASARIISANICWEQVEEWDGYAHVYFNVAPCGPLFLVAFATENPHVPRWTFRNRITRQTYAAGGTLTLPDHALILHTLIPLLDLIQQTLIAERGDL